MFDFNNPVLWYITIGFAVLWVVFTIAERFLIKKRGVDPKKPIEKDYITEIYETRNEAVGEVVDD